jgi:hypothetical protein
MLWDFLQITVTIFCVFALHRIIFIQHIQIQLCDLKNYILLSFSFVYEEFR